MKEEEDAIFPVNTSDSFEGGQTISFSRRRGAVPAEREGYKKGMGGGGDGGEMESQQVRELLALVSMLEVEIDEHKRDADKALGRQLQMHERHLQDFQESAEKDSEVVRDEILEARALKLGSPSYEGTLV